MNFDWFVPAPKSVFFKSLKSGDVRFGEEVAKAHENTPTKGSFIIAGYPDDDGIAINGGRRGAALGPDRIRNFFYKTTPSLYHGGEWQVFDAGNLMTNCELDERHARAAGVVKEAVLSGSKWIGLGGGHDYGYADGAGFLLGNEKSQLKPLIINFDAHLDVRPPDQGLSSGTPFYRLLTDTQLREFDLVEVGVQGQCNSPYHWQWARDNGAEIISFEEIMSSGQNQCAYLSERMAPHLLKKRPTYISIDIDGFSSAYAMGCSQSWPTGFVPNELLPFLSNLYTLLDVQVLGVYEVSPPLDLDDRTVKLAAQIIHQFIGPVA